MFVMKERQYSVVFKCKVIKMPSKQSADKAAIIEAARKGGGKEAVRKNMM